MKKKIFLGVFLTVLAAAIIIGIVNVNNSTALNKGSIGKHIAVVRIEGLIAGGVNDAVFGSVASSESIMRNLRDAAADPGTAAILIRINSPGGSAPASQEIGQEIEKIRKQYKIPIITSMGDVAASGGYWIAATTDKIIANPSTMTGSIGVIMETQSWNELYDKVGIELTNIKSGPHKDMGSTARELTKDEQKILQSMVDDIYEQFVTIVSLGRKLPKEKVREIADGRIFTGRQAQNLKLVDELGNYYDAIEYTKKVAGIEGEPDLKEYGLSSPWDIFKTRAQMPLQQATLLQLVSEMLKVKGVQ